MPQINQRVSQPQRDKPGFVPNFPIPHQSAQAFADHLKSGGVRNAGLIFDRFAPDTRDSNEAKKKGFEQVRDAGKQSDIQLLAALDARWALDAKSVNGEPFKCKTDWRFVTGLGRKGPLEAGFTFNRYGFPILPGSSVKGIARAYAFYDLAQKLNPDELKALVQRLDLDPQKHAPLNALDRLLSEDDADEYSKIFANHFVTATPEARTQANDFRAIFGTTGNAGRAVFFDAIPTSVPKLELDIMNPHFPDYYGDDSKHPTKYPTDWQSPRPVFFLTVAPQTEFCFAVGWRGDVDENARHLRELAKTWLLGGLTELGAGAKTSAGYGYFSKSTGQQSPAPPKPATTAAQLQPAKPANPVVARHTGVGKVRYEAGKPVIRNDEGRWHVNWKDLGMSDLKEKTVVEFEYDEYADGKTQVVRVTKKGG